MATEAESAATAMEPAPGLEMDPATAGELAPVLDSALALRTVLTELESVARRLVAATEREPALARELALAAAASAELAARMAAELVELARLDA